MSNQRREEIGLKIVDAYDLDDELRTILRPGEMIKDAGGMRHRLPRYFYEINSPEEAKSIRLTTHFGLNEFILVDMKEANRLEEFPRYIPCAVRLLAFYLQQLRDRVGASVHIAVNGGYRSPAHKMGIRGTAHMWGTAADIYRIGGEILNNKDAIEKYNKIALDLSDDFWAMPWGHEVNQADDHVHIDLGYLTVVPREINEDRMELPQQRPRFAFEDRRRGDRREQMEAAVPPMASQEESGSTG